MKKLLALALLLVSVVATDAFGRRGGSCRTKCCPTKCPPKKRCGQRELVDQFGYIEQTCEIPTTMPGYQYTECVVECTKNPCNPCFASKQEAAQALEANGYKVVDNVDSAIASAAQRHMMR